MIHSRLLVFGKVQLHSHLLWEMEFKWHFQIKPFFYFIENKMRLIIQTNVEIVLSILLSNFQWHSGMLNCDKNTSYFFRGTTGDAQGVLLDLH